WVRFAFFFVGSAETSIGTLGSFLRFFYFLIRLAEFGIHTMPIQAHHKWGRKRFSVFLNRISVQAIENAVLDFLKNRRERNRRRPAFRVMGQFGRGRLLACATIDNRRQLARVNNPR